MINSDSSARASMGRPAFLELKQTYNSFSSRYGESKYVNLYNREKAILESEDFACYHVFKSAKMLLDELKEKYRKKKNTNWITMFH